jgi:hypothetical protein
MVLLFSFNSINRALKNPKVKHTSTRFSGELRKVPTVHILPNLAGQVLRPLLRLVGTGSRSREHYPELILSQEASTCSSLHGLKKYPYSTARIGAQLAFTMQNFSGV